MNWRSVGGSSLSLQTCVPPKDLLGNKYLKRLHKIENKSGEAVLSLLGAWGSHVPSLRGPVYSANRTNLPCRDSLRMKPYRWTRFKDILKMSFTVIILSQWPPHPVSPPKLYLEFWARLLLSPKSSLCVVSCTSSSLPFQSESLPVSKIADGRLYDQEKWELLVVYLFRSLQVPNSPNR